MAVNYSASLKSTRMQAVITAVDAGSGPGVIEIGTAGMTSILVAITLADPSFTESGAVITMAGAPRSGVASGSGTAASARIKDSNNNIVVSGLTVGVSGSDINLASVAITSGQTVTLTSATITHSP